MIKCISSEGNRCEICKYQDILSFPWSYSKKFICIYVILFQIKNDNFIGLKLPSGKKEVNKIIQNRDYYLLNRQKYNQTQITVSEKLCIWYICIQTGDFFLKEFIWDTLTLIHVDRKYPPPFNIANSYLDFKRPGMIHVF